MSANAPAGYEWNTGDDVVEMRKFSAHHLSVMDDDTLITVARDNLWRNSTSYAQRNAFAAFAFISLLLAVIEIILIGQAPTDDALLVQRGVLYLSCLFFVLGRWMHLNAMPRVRWLRPPTRLEAELNVSSADVASFREPASFSSQPTLFRIEPVGWCERLAAACEPLALFELGFLVLGVVLLWFSHTGFACLRVFRIYRFPLSLSPGSFRSCIFSRSVQASLTTCCACAYCAKRYLWYFQERDAGDEPGAGRRAERHGPLSRLARATTSLLEAAAREGMCGPRSRGAVALLAMLALAVYVLGAVVWLEVGATGALVPVAVRPILGGACTCWRGPCACFCFILEVLNTTLRSVVSPITPFSCSILCLCLYLYYSFIFSFLVLSGGCHVFVCMWGYFLCRFVAPHAGR